MSSPIPATTYSVHGIAEMAPRPARTAGAVGDGVPGDDVQENHPLFGKDGFTFSDFLDIINPLQHIPIVSTVYRAITGDKIDPGARLAGGGLFGGPIGLAASVVSGIIEETTGKDPGEHALAALGIDIGPAGKDEPATMVAEAAARSEAVAPAELQAQGAQMQAAQAKTAQTPGQDMKLGVTMDNGRGRKPAEATAAQGRQTAQSAGKSDGPIELPADLFQALKQTAAAQQADARSAVVNGAQANPIPGQQPQARAAGPMQTNAMPGTGNPMPDNAIRAADGRTWFPAFPMGGGGVPTRAVGTSPVTPTAVTSKFGVTKGNNFATTPQAATAASATMLQGVDQQNEWANRASDAYQKYFEMQDQKNRRAGIVQ